MSGGVDARLQRLLGGDPLALLRRRLRKCFEHAPLDSPVERLCLSKLTAEEHAALAALLGRGQRPSKSLSIDVQLIDAALQRAGIAPSLRHALEQLDGPIIHRATEQQRLERLWSEVIGGCKHPDLEALLETAGGFGLLKRLAGQDAPRATQLCQRVEAVLQRLPASGVPRSQLAADALGDAHALDDGQAAATLVLAAWRRRVPSARDDGDNMPLASSDNGDARRTADKERSRAVWARAGVLVNELARPALFLNLPAHDAERNGWPPGEPAYASLRSLLRSPPRWNVAGRKIHVCENANFLAIAADHWGARCAPLVCTDGAPAAAQQCVLSQMVQAGARLYYHGDFDWPGLWIGNCVIRRYGARPWRFNAADYLAALQTASRFGQVLKGRAVEAIWDSALTTAMQAHQVAIAEEAVASLLLQDLCD